MNARRGSGLLGAYYFGLILLLYLPLALLFLFSVNASASLSFPIRELTLHWYQQLFDAGAGEQPCDCKAGRRAAPG